MDALVHMLVHLWTRPQQDSQELWIFSILPHVPGLLIIGVALLVFRKKTAPGRARNTALAGLLMLFFVSAAMAALNVLMLRSSTVMRRVLDDFFFLIWPGRPLLELAAYGLLFWVLLRMQPQAMARAAAIKPFALLLGAAALRYGPPILHWGHGGFYLAHNMRLLWLASTLLWLAGLVLLLCALIAVLRHDGA